MTTWREISRLWCAVWCVKGTRDALRAQRSRRASRLSPKCGHGPTLRRPRMSVGQNGKRWPFACHSRESHGTRPPDANRQCVHKPHALQWPLAPRHAQPHHKPWPRPPHRAVKHEVTTAVSGNVGTRQEFSCEVHGPAAIRGP